MSPLQASSTKKKRQQYGVPGFSRGLELIELLCEADRPLGVSDLSLRLGVNKHMVFRLLHTLIDAGWIVADGEGPKYRMTLVPFHHASKPVVRMDLFSAAEQPIRELWEEIGEAVYLGILDQDMVMYLLHRDGRRDVRLGGRVGIHYWPHCGAPGKVLLAHSSPEVVERVIQRGLKKMTIATIVNPDALRRELKQVREQGYGTDLEEYTTGGMCYAAPIFDYAGRMTAVVGTTVMTLHYSPAEMLNQLGPKVQTAARRISLALGARNIQMEKRV